MNRKNQLQNILKIYGEEYFKKHNLPSYIRKTLVDIESCRTSQLGGHIDNVMTVVILEYLIILVETGTVLIVKH